MPEPHITAHSGIRCDRLCPFIAELTSFTVIINQSHQYFTEPNGLTALGRDEPFLLFVFEKFTVSFTIFISCFYLKSKLRDPGIVDLSYPARVLST